MRTRTQCPAQIKTPSNWYYDCQKREGHRGEHVAIVRWKGTADPVTRSCGSTFCPGGERKGEIPTRADVAPSAS